jgi:hypothetical protein
MILLIVISCMKVNTVLGEFITFCSSLSTIYHRRGMRNCLITTDIHLQKYEIHNLN